jgi:hypothetical protein
MITPRCHVSQAVALFNASRHDEAMRRIQELATAYQRSDTLPCSVVNVSLSSNLMSLLTLERIRQSYLRVQLAIIAFDDGRYSEAAERLSEDIPSITDLFSRGALSEPRMKVFTVVRHYDTTETTSTDR